MTGPGYFIHQDPDRLFVEAWSAWHLPFMNLTPAQSKYRDELRTAIRPDGNRTLHATYTSSQDARWAPDLENVLFYNLGTSVFREVARMSSASRGRMLQHLILEQPSTSLPAITCDTQ